MLISTEEFKTIATMLENLGIEGCQVKIQEHDDWSKMQISIPNTSIDLMVIRANEKA